MPMNPYQQGGSQYGRLGPRGGVYSPRPQQGLLPAPRSGATRVLDFIDGFKEKQKREKAEAKKEFEEAMKMLEAGIPIDQNKTARLARKAGLDFDYDGPTRKEVQAQNQQRMQQAQQAQQAQQGMMMPPMGPGGRSLPSMTPRPNLAGMQQGMQQPLPAPRQQPGLASRMMSGMMGGMGMKPTPTGPIPQNAGIMKYLQQAQQKGKLQSDTAMGLLESGKKRQELVMTVISSPPGSPEHTDAVAQLASLTAAKGGVDAKNLPVGVQIAIAKKSGLPESIINARWGNKGKTPQDIRKEALGLVAGLKAGFGGDPEKTYQFVHEILTTGDSSIKPTTPEKANPKVWEIWRSIHSAYHVTNPGQAMKMAMSTDPRILNNSAEWGKVGTPKTPGAPNPTEQERKQVELKKKKHLARAEELANQYVAKAAKKAGIASKGEREYGLPRITGAESAEDKAKRINLITYALELIQNDVTNTDIYDYIAEMNAYLERQLGGGGPLGARDINVNLITGPAAGN